MADDLNPTTREEVLLAGNEPGLTPNNREEAILAGGDLAPNTKRECFLKEYRGGGGSSVTVEPLTLTQNGTTTAPSGKAYSPVTVNVPQPSGTINITTNGPEDVSMSAVANVDVNPSVVWMNDGTNDGTATLANPFSGLDYSALYNAIYTTIGKLNALIQFNFNGITVLLHPFGFGDEIMASVYGSVNGIGLDIAWSKSGSLNRCVALMNGQQQDLSSMAERILCRTIIYGTTEPTFAT